MLHSVAGEKAKQLAEAIGFLNGKVEEKRMAGAALEEVAENPEDPEALQELCRQSESLIAPAATTPPLSHAIAKAPASAASRSRILLKDKEPT